MATVWRLVGLFLALSVLAVVLFDAAVATWGRERSYDISMGSNGEISADGRASVAAIARTMARDGSYRATLKGYAPAGIDELAAKRTAATDTQAIREALIAHGVPEGRLTLLAPATFKGASPVAGAKPEAGAAGDGAKGRKVTVVITK